MFPFLLISGAVLILAGLFNKQSLRLVGLKPMSEVFTSPNLKRSTRIVEQIGRWLAIFLGASFLIMGLRGILPNAIVYEVPLVLFGLSALMLLTIIGITLANWKAK